MLQECVWFGGVVFWGGEEEREEERERGRGKGDILTKTWVFENSTIQLSTGKRKTKEKERKKKTEKIPGRVRNDWTTEISPFFDPEMLANFRAVSGKGKMMITKKEKKGPK